MSKTPVTVYFLLGEYEGYRACGANLETIEDDIRYWLGKSPGICIDEITRIEIVPSDSTNYFYLIEKFKEEQAKYELERYEQQQRADYERLKKKFNHE